MGLGAIRLILLLIADGAFCILNEDAANKVEN